MLITDVFEPSRFEADGNIHLKEGEISYHTICEDNVFYSNNGRPVASVFSYSYFRKDIPDVDGRPVLFAFNGGPGTSSMMIHAGFLGAIRVKYGDVKDIGTPLPPYESCENMQSLLGVMDICVIDPVGTGFGRLIDPEAKDEFYGIEQDAESMLVFVQKWLDRYGRWKSPKYLMGESYGCTRAATMAGMASLGADRAFSMAFDGLIMIGNTVTNNQHFQAKGIMYPSVLTFPTLAAVNWYHKRPTDQGVGEFVKEAKQFADTEYLLALYRGDLLAQEEKEHMINKIMYYTGVSREYLVSRNLMVEEWAFRNELLKNEKYSVSRLDGRFKRPIYKEEIQESKWGLLDDAADGKYDPFFQAVLCGDIFPSLNIKWDRNFVSSTKSWMTWNNEIKGRNTSRSLSDAMRRIPEMRVMFINGYYDICTQIGLLYYTLDHSDLPMDRVEVKLYESGHMAYLGEDNIQKVSDDIKKFVIK